MSGKDPLISLWMNVMRIGGPYGYPNEKFRTMKMSKVFVPFGDMSDLGIGFEENARQETLRPARQLYQD